MARRPGTLGNGVPRSGAHSPHPPQFRRFPIGPERRQATVGGAWPGRRRSYWTGRARWEGRFEKKQPAPRGTPRADWLSRGLAPASERATGTGWGQKRCGGRADGRDGTAALHSHSHSHGSHPERFPPPPPPASPAGVSRLVRRGEGALSG